MSGLAEAMEHTVAAAVELARQGELTPPQFRSNRIFRSDGLWYFHTREGIDVGPFNSLADARAEVGLLVRRLGEMGSEHILSVIRELQLDAQVVAGKLEAQDFVSYVDDSQTIEPSEFAQIVKLYKAQNSLLDADVA